MLTNGELRLRSSSISLRRKLDEGREYTRVSGETVMSSSRKCHRLKPESPSPNGDASPYGAFSGWQGNPTPRVSSAFLVLKCRCEHLTCEHKPTLLTLSHLLDPLLPPHVHTQINRKKGRGERSRQRTSCSYIRFQKQTRLSSLVLLIMLLWLL